jgi:hypothetical protein
MPRRHQWIGALVAQHKHFTAFGDLDTDWVRGSLGGIFRSLRDAFILPAFILHHGRLDCWIDSRGWISIRLLRY